MALLLPWIHSEHSKDYSGPIHRVGVSGIQLENQNMTVAFPTAKIRGIQSGVSNILQNKIIALQTLSQLLEAS